MSKEICISTTPHETRLAILENDELTEIYYERENEYTLAGSIYKGRVTRVLPGMQSAFVDIGLERDAFLYVTDFLEEQDEGADFESANGNGQRGRRDTVREGGHENYSATRQEGGTAPESEESEAQQDSDSPSGTRRWRGRRGRRRGFRSRGQHEERSQLESPAAVEESVSGEPADVPEHGAPGGMLAATRILLPGESLSKYGGTAVAETKAEPSLQPPSARVNYTAPKPSTLIESPLQWDGGLLMPGESLSRYRDRAPEQAVERHAETSVVETQAESGAPEAVPQAAESEGDVPVHGGRVEPYGHILESAAEPAEAESEANAEVHHAAFAEAAFEGGPEPAQAGTAVAGTPTESAADEIHEEVHEYEPETASASHRIDPAAPSEFRVSSVVEEETPGSEDIETITQEVREQARIDEHSATDTLDYADEAAAPQVAEMADQLFGFAPGSGVLEEEVIEEEEYDFEPIHRHADEHDSEDLEEETLDHAGELGEMVRDSHLEQRLHGGPAVDESEEAEVEDGDEDEEDGEEPSFTSEERVERGPEMAANEPARPRRDGERRGGRRGDRRGDRRGHGGPRRHSAQTMDLPIISDLLKQGQEILVQIAKEPIAKKGARITSHIALPGRFLVFMPTVNHVGVSRKISSDEERQRLKRILISEKGEASGGFIVRTAADGASEDELRADLRFLISLWNDIRQRADSSKAPALIYHDLNLVERVLRDQVSDNFSAVWVDNEMEYERTVRFLNRFQPSLVRRVKLYTKETPLFEQFGIQEEITKALKSKVWLKSGGSIVINQTEALVAIDINTGKYVGKTARLEDTILKTNLDAIPEIVRQIRLRDLGGIIVIDFIDMDERKNRHKVMQALEEELKNDRAPSKVLQFNDFGLVAITRKRVKQSLERTLSTPCPICTGTGMVKSPTTVANEIFVEMRKMQRHLEGRDVMLRVNPEVVKVLKANNARWLNELEEMIGKTIIVKSDATLHPEQFDIH
ncbi:MAG: Rne/Rng family ribonuclease [Silvibacterium sp.]|nr:Rne/Rng family ribonuclease [Silvibacterium sp.]